MPGIWAKGRVPSRSCFFRLCHGLFSLDCHDFMNLVASVSNRALTIGSPRGNSCLVPPLFLVGWIVSG